MEPTMIANSASETTTPNLVLDTSLRNRLSSRRERLVAGLAQVNAAELRELLQEVDAALQRMDAGTFGFCETCHGTIESERLLADPLARNCLDHLSPQERKALERDLDLAFQVQLGLLPDAALRIDGWSMAYAYEAAGPVSGDYCDVLPLEGGAGLFMLGDVTGKGVAASMLMAQLHATFRSLATITHSVTELVAKANRMFGQANATSHFATLVCGYFTPDASIEICNAGHCPPLHVSGGKVTAIDSTGLPVGVVRETDYGAHRLRLAPGDSLVLYTDGVSEAFNSSRQQYGSKRLTELVQRHAASDPGPMRDAIRGDIQKFRSGASATDDLTILILRRNAPTHS